MVVATEDSLPSKVSIPNPRPGLHTQTCKGRMKTKFTNNLVDLVTGPKANNTVFKMWGGETPVSMGDGIRFRVKKSKTVDYVYVRYLSGFDEYEIEFGALVGTEYDVLDRIKPVKSDAVMATISRRLFFGD
jgi:hypothetical protein